MLLRELQGLLVIFEGELGVQFIVGVIDRAAQFDGDGLRVVVVGADEVGLVDVVSVDVRGHGDEDAVKTSAKLRKIGLKMRRENYTQSKQ